MKKYEESVAFSMNVEAVTYDGQKLTRVEPLLSFWLGCKRRIAARDKSSAYLALI